MPETSGNTTLASTSGKTTSTSYGGVKFTNLVNTKSASVWLRSIVGSEYHYWLPYMVSIGDLNTNHTVYYCDGYSSKGTAADLRAENDTQALDIWTEKVSGEVHFN